MSKRGGNTKQSRRHNNNTTTQKGDRDGVNHQTIKFTYFSSETWAMVSPEANKWFIRPKEAAAAGEYIYVKYGVQ